MRSNAGSPKESPLSQLNHFNNTSATGIRDYLHTGVGFTVEFSKKWSAAFFYNAAAGNGDLTSQNIFWCRQW